MAKMQLPPDFSEFLSGLNSAQVEYLLLGGYAVAYYGVPRTTGGMDIWVNPTPDNVARLVATLVAFGFANPPPAERFLQPRQVFRMGVPPLRIELLTTVSGVVFAEAFARKAVVSVGGVSVNMISLADLKANKRAAGRRKDLDDLDRLA
jgi:hypothetical protein